MMDNSTKMGGAFVTDNTVDQIYMKDTHPASTTAVSQSALHC